MASTLNPRPLHRSSSIIFCFRGSPSPFSEGLRIPRLGWHPHGGNKYGAGPFLGFPCFPRHHACHPLPSLPVRLEVLSPPRRFRILHQFRSHRPLTMASAASDSSQPSPSTKTVRVTIKGRVQGVFYRDWTVENASKLGLNGWVRNRRGGSVEALFSGKPDLVDEMVQRCRLGPPQAIVTALQVSPCNDDPGSGFLRKLTA
ncbi:hypothetical protein SAY86_027661 [Trapa natans]|uniref:acylphosphatase n=1 Tax=Trapa natans TaxID=22666 RepID=A0AAN7KLT3_TRANT|nr:hypothetical protein SAY86_027661 [Trapa natans]